MVTPKKIVIFVGFVLTCLLFISLCFPNSEIRISENKKLKFPSLTDIFAPNRVKYADISNLIEFSEELNDTVNILSRTTVTTVAANQKVGKTDTIRSNTDELLKNTRLIEYPKNDNTVLYAFFYDLSRVNQLNKPVRIMHYGDSQIEGDRITSFIRDRLQSNFGGSGPGLLPVVQPYGQFSMKQDISSNWKRYTVFGKEDSGLYHNRYGALASFCRFSPIKKTGNKSFEAWFKARYCGLSYNTARQYEKFRIFYGYNKKPFLAQIYTGEEMIDADFIPVTNELKVLEWSFDQTPPNITVKLKGEDSPDFYAISFESKKGVLVDNIPMRGSSGLIFTKIDKELLKKMYHQLNVNLIILQYGGNTVPYISNGYEKYGKSFYNQLIRLKSIVPGVPIIVIGVADMSTKEKDYYVTYPVIPKVRDALKNAAFKAGCAYWDMYEAMGGKNSMPSWVFADPSLASSDFVHFNHKGARLIAEMFYNALLYDYNQYCIATGKVNLAMAD